MKFLNVDIPVKNLPQLDPGFVPLGAFFQSYAKGAQKPLCIAVERLSLIHIFWGRRP